MFSLYGNTALVNHLAKFNCGKIPFDRFCVKEQDVHLVSTCLISNEKVSGIAKYQH